MSEVRKTETKIPAVFYHLDALVHDQCNKLGNSRKSKNLDISNDFGRLDDNPDNWKKLADDSAKFLEDRNFTEDKDLGRYIYNFLSDPSWVKRRVERITIFTEGQTRRALSFDVEVPYEKSAIVNDQVYVPVTLLRKGMLTDFDSTNEAGESIPNLGYTDNGRLSWRGITYAADHTVLTGLSSVFKNCNLTKREFLRIIYTGIAKVQLSEGCEEIAMDKKVVYRSQEISRHNIFSFLAQLCLYLDNGQYQESDNLVYFPWLKDTNLSETPLSEVSMEQEVFDSDESVQLLMVAILQRARECAAGQENFES